MVKNNKIARTYRIAKEADERIRALSEQYDLSQGEVVELAVQHFITTVERGAPDVRSTEVRRKPIEEEEREEEGPRYHVRWDIPPSRSCPEGRPGSITILETGVEIEEPEEMARIWRQIKANPKLAR